MFTRTKPVFSLKHGVTYKVLPKPLRCFRIRLEETKITNPYIYADEFTLTHPVGSKRSIFIKPKR